MRTILITITITLVITALLSIDGMGQNTNVRMSTFSKPCTNPSVEMQISRLSNRRLVVRREAARALMTAAATCMKSNIVEKKLMRKLTYFCSSDDAVAMTKDFQQFSEISDIISRLNYTPALKTMIPCVNQSSVVTGLSDAHYPAKAALKKFGKQAIPSIIEALLHGTESIKCPLIETLVGIGGEDALRALRTAAMVAQGPDTKKCLEMGLELLN